LYWLKNYHFLDRQIWVTFRKSAIFLFLASVFHLLVHIFIVKVKDLQHYLYFFFYLEA
jgi:hypothetical protein